MKSRLALAVVLGFGLADPPASAEADYAAEHAEMVRVVEDYAGQPGSAVSGGRLAPEVLRVMGTVPRHEFVPDRLRADAYTDRPLPIGFGQTISQPFIVAIMTDLLRVGKNDAVLEIGTGSGYQAAVLSRLARRIYSIERHKVLLAEAEQRFKDLRLTNIHCRYGDGSLGWPEQTDFDRIMVTAAAATLPEALLKQLKDGGILVAPIGSERGDQLLMRYRRHGEQWSEEALGEVRFVPLLPGAVEASGGRGGAASATDAGAGAGPRRRTLA
jgi:protein-L-isoaspartate(D-aspartate) O-methyltransferase